MSCYFFFYISLAATHSCGQKYLFFFPVKKLRSFAFFFLFHLFICSSIFGQLLSHTSSSCILLRNMILLFHSPQQNLADAQLIFSDCFILFLSDLPLLSFSLLIIALPSKLGSPPLFIQPMCCQFLNPEASFLLP